MKILIEESVLRQALEALEPHKSTVLRDAADEVAGGWPADHLRHMAEERERGT